MKVTIDISGNTIKHNEKSIIGMNTNNFCIMQHGNHIEKIGTLEQCINYVESNKVEIMDNVETKEEISDDDIIRDGIIYE